MVNAYLYLVNGIHQNYVIKIEPEFTDEAQSVTIHMGVEYDTGARKFLPVIGKV